MPSTLPDGEPVPDDGALPASAAQAWSAGPTPTPLSVYVHVPFCAARCGYCDFNTYTAAELGEGASRAEFAATAAAEVRLARRVLDPVTTRVDTVFVGGGTPTLLPAADLGEVLRVIDGEFGLAPDAEVTTEANPDSVTPEQLAALREAGFTRISFGMQSAVPRVLDLLDRTHDPEGVPRAVAWARQAGFTQVSLDLIYGTPGERPQDWETSLDAALACAPDHVSAYALIVEDGTALARRVRRGELPAPDDDDLAAKYEIADARLRAAGLDWYEVSNWARPGAACRHNLGYWRGADWWGIGPGAHSHIAGTRWWNVKHPQAYAARLAQGRSPAHAREVLTEEDRTLEQVLLEIRLREGLPLQTLAAFHPSVGHVAGVVEAEIAAGLLDPAPLADAGRLVLTEAGRLLADAVVRRLVG
ncbi:radical SAM family heme chaperone HemW [Nocardioides sp.]|uniref:radical SAM family heme chaperone HemW n=1 Tax=Nocardioides sp. TaxID=35761 RepID=UPI003512126D